MKKLLQKIKLILLIISCVGVFSYPIIILIGRNKGAILEKIGYLSDGSLFLSSNYTGYFLIFLILIFLFSMLFAIAKWKTKINLTISLLSLLAFIVVFNCFNYSLTFKPSPYSTYEILVRGGEEKEPTALLSYLYENFRNRNAYTSTLDFGKYFRKEKNFTSEWDYEDYIQSVSGVKFRLNTNLNFKIGNEHLDMIQLFPIVSLSDANSKKWIIIKPDCFEKDIDYLVIISEMRSGVYYLIPKNIIDFLNNWSEE